MRFSVIFFQNVIFALLQTILFPHKNDFYGFLCGFYYSGLANLIIFIELGLSSLKGTLPTGILRGTCELLQ